MARLLLGPPLSFLLFNSLLANSPAAEVVQETFINLRSAPSSLSMKNLIAKLHAKRWWSKVAYGMSAEEERETGQPLSQVADERIHQALARATLQCEADSLDDWAIILNVTKWLFAKTFTAQHFVLFFQRRINEEKKRRAAYLALLTLSRGMGRWKAWDLKTTLAGRFQVFLVILTRHISDGDTPTFFCIYIWFSDYIVYIKVKESIGNGLADPSQI